MFAEILYTNAVLETSIGGINVDEFWDSYGKRINSSGLVGTDYAPPCYDSVWAAALALNKTVDKMKQKGTPTNTSLHSHICIYAVPLKLRYVKMMS